MRIYENVVPSAIKVWPFSNGEPQRSFEGIMYAHVCANGVSTCGARRAHWHEQRQKVSKAWLQTGSGLFIIPRIDCNDTFWIGRTPISTINQWDFDTASIGVCKKLSTGGFTSYFSAFSLPVSLVVCFEKLQDLPYWTATNGKFQPSEKLELRQHVGVWNRYCRHRCHRYIINEPQHSRIVGCMYCKRQQICLRPHASFLLGYIYTIDSRIFLNQATWMKILWRRGMKDKTPVERIPNATSLCKRMALEHLRPHPIAPCLALLHIVPVGRPSHDNHHL